MDNVIVNEYTELLEKKARLQKGLSVLPQGYISKKNINGKTYHLSAKQSLRENGGDIFEKE